VTAAVRAYSDPRLAAARASGSEPLIDSDSETPSQAPSQEAAVAAGRLGTEPAAAAQSRDSDGCCGSHCANFTAKSNRHWHGCHGHGHWH
jgi:hypothetical protein